MNFPERFNECGYSRYQAVGKSKKNPYIWHFVFHSLPELPELLVYGKQAAYFDYFYNEISKDPSAIDKKKGLNM